MQMSKIIVGGDSFSDKNQPQYSIPEPLDFKMWPEIVGEKLNCEVINTARSGYGNDAIYHQTLKAIMNNKDVDHVFVMWSEWTRQDFLLDNDREYASLMNMHFDVEYNKDAIDKWYNDSFNKNFPKKNDPNFVAPIPSMEQFVNTNINYIYSLQVICEKLNIKYTAVQAMDTCILPSCITKHPHLNHIKNFHGWPPILGRNMCFSLKMEYGKDYKISDEDHHPNEISQKFIADKMLEYANLIRYANV